MKRILAWILVLMMLVCCAPLSFAEESSPENGETVQETLQQEPAENETPAKEETKPAVTEPSDPEPAAESKEPAVTESTEPADAEPSGTEPAATEPADAEPAAETTEPAENTDTSGEPAGQSTPAATEGTPAAGTPAQPAPTAPPVHFSRGYVRVISGNRIYAWPRESTVGINDGDVCAYAELVEKAEDPKEDWVCLFCSRDGRLSKVYVQYKIVTPLKELETAELLKQLKRIHAPKQDDLYLAPIRYTTDKAPEETVVEIFDSNCQTLPEPEQKETSQPDVTTADDGDTEPEGDKNEDTEPEEDTDKDIEPGADADKDEDTEPEEDTDKDTEPEGDKDEGAEPDGDKNEDTEPDGDTDKDTEPEEDADKDTESGEDTDIDTKPEEDKDEDAEPGADTLDMPGDAPVQGDLPLLEMQSMNVMMAPSMSLMAMPPLMAPGDPEPVPIADLDITWESEDDPVYDGTEQKKVPVVMDGTKKLVEGTDYILTYANNIRASDTAPSVTIEGVGDYGGSKTINFAIQKRALALTPVSLVLYDISLTGQSISSDPPTYDVDITGGSLDELTYTTVVGTQADKIVTISSDRHVLTMNMSLITVEEGKKYTFKIYGYTIKLGQEDVTDCYDVTANEGILLYREKYLKLQMAAADCYDDEVPLICKEFRLDDVGPGYIGADFIVEDESQKENGIVRYSGYTVTVLESTVLNEVGQAENKPLKVKIVDNNNNDCTDEFAIQYVEKCYLTVKQRTKVIVVPDGGSKTFGEKDPESFAYSVQDESGQPIDLALEGKLGRAAGENAGSYAFNLGTMTEDGNNEGFILELQPANFVINRKNLADTDIKVEAIPDVMYDGKEKKPTPKVTYPAPNGTTYTLGATDVKYTYAYNTHVAVAAKNEKTVLNLTTDGLQGCNYTGTREVPFNIKPRKIVLTSSSASKLYNGKPLYKKEVKISGDGLAQGDGLSYDSWASQTEVGWCKNTFEYTAKTSRTRLTDYKISCEYGQLEVEPSSVTLVISASSATWEYDGEEHSSPIWYIDYGTDHYKGKSGETIEIRNGMSFTATVEGSVRNVGDVTDGNNVIASYIQYPESVEMKIKVEAGTLTITPKPVKVNWTGEKEAAYDGREHTMYAEAEGLLPADEVLFTNIGGNTGVEPGHYVAMAQFTAPSARVLQNYKFPKNDVLQKKDWYIIRGSSTTGRLPGDITTRQGYGGYCMDNISRPVLIPLGNSLEQAGYADILFEYGGENPDETLFSAIFHDVLPTKILPTEPGELDELVAEGWEAIIPEPMTELDMDSDTVTPSQETEWIVDLTQETEGYEVIGYHTLNFFDGPVLRGGERANTIVVNWSEAHQTVLTYENGLYTRNSLGKRGELIPEMIGKQPVTFTNVIVQSILSPEEREEAEDDDEFLITGDADYFTAGLHRTGTWDLLNGRVRYLDQNGKEIRMNKGTTLILLFDDDTQGRDISWMDE